MSSPSVTIIIPTIPTRSDTLIRSLKSVATQDYPIYDVIVETDTDGRGAAYTRQKALERVETEWYIPLDDDDEFFPDGVSKLVETQTQTGADYVYGHYEVIGGTDPRPENYGRPFDPENPTQTTVVAMARTQKSLELGGYLDPYNDVTLKSPDRHYGGEDWLLTQRYISAKLSIVHCPHKVFKWYHHGNNTSGLPWI